MRNYFLWRFVLCIFAILTAGEVLGQVNIKNGLFIVAFKIERGSSTQMPPNLKGAHVVAFSAATDPEAAVKLAATKLKSQGFLIIDIQPKVQQLDPTQWNEYVHKVWPEFKNHFPTQAQVSSGIKEGRVFFGPFAGYEN